VTYQNNTMRATIHSAPISSVWCTQIPAVYQYIYLKNITTSSWCITEISMVYPFTSSSSSLTHH